MKRLKLVLITNDVSLGRHALEAGVDRLFVDLETRGKEERQGHLDAHRATHAPGDVRVLRDALPGAEILARVNPLWDGSPEEIDTVIAGGADLVMLPMFRSSEEVGAFLELVDGRAAASLLLETPEAFLRVDEILRYAERIDEIHVGLNDLHLGMGADFMFEPLSGGMVDLLSERIRAHGVRFGFGGVARVGEGRVPAEMVIGEHVRLGSEMVILSRSFHGQARTLDDVRRDFDLGTEVARVRACEEEFRTSGPEVLERNRARLKSAVRDVARSRRDLSRLLPASTNGSRGALAGGVSRVLLLAPRREVEPSFASLAENLRPDLAPVPVMVVRGWEDRALEVAGRGDALVAGGHERTREVLQSGPEWRWFHLMSAGWDHIADWEPVPGDPLITYSRGVNSASMAQWVIGAILYFYRDFDLYARGDAARRWQRTWSRELEGRTLVVLGAGAAGSEVARVARPLGMRTIGISRSGRSLPGFDQVRQAHLAPEILPEADVTVVLLPGGPETRGAMGPVEIEGLKEGSLLIVASRGGIVDEGAVVDAVERGRLEGAAFDVFEEEPLPPDSPLWGNPRILVTPHVAGTTDRFMERTGGILRSIWCDSPCADREIGAMEYYRWLQAPVLS